jgi:cytoskeleton protein RodZ
MELTMECQLGGATPVTFGDELRRERARRQLTLNQASVATRIRESILDAIENGEVDRLPSPVFAIGLVRSYAKFLNCDGEPYANLLRVSIAERESAVPIPVHGPIRPRSTALSGFVLPFTIVVVLLILSGYLYQQYTAFVAGAANIEARPLAEAGIITTPLPTPPAEPSVVAAPSIQIVSASPTVAVTPTPTTSPIRPTETAVTTAIAVHGVRIDAETSGRVWVQVETDGTVAFAGIINAGEKRTWSASNKLLLWSGNAGNVSVTFNGKPLGPLGAPGEVMKVTWTATD